MARTWRKSPERREKRETTAEQEGLRLIEASAIFWAGYDDLGPRPGDSGYEEYRRREMLNGLCYGCYPEPSQYAYEEIFYKGNLVSVHRLSYQTLRMLTYDWRLDVNDLCFIAPFVLVHAPESEA